MQSDDEQEPRASQWWYPRDETDENPTSPGDLRNGTGETTPSNGIDKKNFHPDGEMQTAYYNAAQEKSLSHQEAKLFYQRHQLEEAEAQNPLARAQTYSSTFDGDCGLSRTTSTTSRRSGRTSTQQDRNWKFSIPPPEPNLRSPSINGADSTGPDDDGALGSDLADAESAGHGTTFGSDFEDRAVSGSDFSPELSAISVNIKKVLDLRHKYIALSLQGPMDNPKDSPDWKIYPPPPHPTWDENKNRPLGQSSASNSMNSSKILPPGLERMSGGDLPSNASIGDSAQQQQTFPTVKDRKPGQDIGDDFDMKDLTPLPGHDECMSFKLDESSIYQIFDTSQPLSNHSPAFKVPTLRDYYVDMDDIQKVSSDGPTKSFAYRQLDILEGKFQLYFLVNSYQETADCKRVPHRDFYNVRKVDTHVHHSACMNQKHLLRFIKSKMKKSPDEVVMYRDNKHLTLRQVFESIHLTAYDLSIDTLDMHVGEPSFPNT